MGGQALKNTFTRRYERAEYECLCAQVMAQLTADFPERQMAVIPAYRHKNSFGDLDILFELDDLHLNLGEYLQARFKPNEIVRNDAVYSFDFQQFQIDLIGSYSADFAISLHYFAWNDLGNLLGRIYHKMGFKYGHTGLSLVVRDGDYVLGEIQLSKNIDAILGLADWDAERFHAGFDDLEAIFRYVTATPYFNKAIYELDNRNHASRIRDRKRPTYHTFLQWLALQNELPAYPWQQLREQGGRQLNPVFLEKAFAHFPAAQPEYAQLLAAYADQQARKAKFNGQLVQTWTGLEGKALGQCMIQLKQQGQHEWGDFDAWLQTAAPEAVRQWVLERYRLGLV